MVDSEQWNRDGGTSGTIEQRWLKNDTGTVEERWCNSGTVMVEQWNNDGGTVEQ